MEQIRKIVLLHSLGGDVFPLDSNTFRILKRTGVLCLRSIYPRRGLHDGLPDAVEASRRKPFHINLVIHGRRTCLPRRPRCSGRAMCRVRADIKADVRSGTCNESGVVTVSRTRALT